MDYLSQFKNIDVYKEEVEIVRTISVRVTRYSFSDYKEKYKLYGFRRAYFPMLF